MMIDLNNREIKLLKEGLNSVKEYTTEHDDLFSKLNANNNYREAFEILLEYWDSLPDEEKPKIDERLNKLNL